MDGWRDLFDSGGVESRCGKVTIPKQSVGTHDIYHQDLSQLSSLLDHE